MSKLTEKWVAIGLWFVAASLALFVGGSCCRLWEGIQDGSDVGIRRGLIMAAFYGTCFLIAVLAIALRRKETQHQAQYSGTP